MNQAIRSFNQDFDAIITLHGERTALIPTADGQQPLSYAQLGQLVARHQAWFGQLGLKPGDRVGALMPNSVEMLALFLACLRGGYGFAPLACDTASVEAEAWVALLRPVCVVVGEILPAPVRAGLKASGVRCEQISNMGDFAHLPAEASATTGVAGAKLFLYTSGTTGQPKAIVLDGDRLWSSGHAFMRLHVIGFDSPFRIWNYLPQSYLGGLFNLCLIPMSVAGSVVVDEAFSGKTFLRFWQTVDRYDLSALWLVPTIVKGLLALAEHTRRNEAKSYKDVVKVAFLGTAPIELAAKERFAELFGIKLLENYGLSETTFITSERAGDTHRQEGSAGTPLASLELKFRPLADEADPTFQEILVKTPYLFDGYLDSDNTISAGLFDGFFPTGDLGTVNAKGQLLITGRCKDVIKKGGQLIALRELEVVALRHPAVVNAAATPVPHPFYGESYRLLVELAPGAESGALDTVKKFFFDNVAKYKWPDRIDAVAQFPQTGSGKIRKFLLGKGE